MNHDCIINTEVSLLELPAVPSEDTPIITCSVLRKPARTQTPTKLFNLYCGHGFFSELLTYISRAHVPNFEKTLISCGRDPVTLHCLKRNDIILRRFIPVVLWTIKVTVNPLQQNCLFRC